MALVDDTNKLSNSVKLDSDSRQTVVEKISDQFDKVFAPINDSDDLPEPHVTAAERASKAAPAAKEAVSTDVEKPSPTDGDGPEPKTDVAEEAAASDAPILPASHIRSLKAAGWTDEEITESAAQLGDKFLAFSSKVHAGRNAETARLAELGRQTQARQQATPVIQAAPAASSSTGLKPFDIKALKGKYGDDALIDELVGPVNQVIEHLNRMTPQVQAFQNQARNTANETLGKQVDAFFGDASLKDFHETYGKSSAAATDAQMGSRAQVLQLADALIAGGTLQGRSYSVEEALTMALDHHTADQQKNVARAEIRKGLKDRTKAITLRPSGKAGPTSKPGDSRKELESRVGKKLAEIFK